MQTPAAIKTNYTLNYLKIYIWQILSIVLNLGALFIVLPSIAKNKDLYGIYSVCISLTIFLSYADLGFVNAGTKYAAEFYAMQDRLKEKRIIGFAAFILFIFILIFSFIVGAIAIRPEWMFNDIKQEDAKVATYLLGTLALFAPITVFQRTLQMIFSIRLEDYILQIALIIANALKIVSVFFFFNEQTYNITGYFLCYQLLSLLALLIAGIIAQKKYDISFFGLSKYFKFSKEIYTQTRKLAFGSLFVTISWILFYELDPYVLARLTGPATLAVYAVGLTLLSFYRSIFGALFSPFVARFNHLIGLNDYSSLKSLYSTIMVVMLPFIFFSITALFFVARPFIFSWLGPQFEQSILPTRILIFSNILAFISYPCSILLVAKQKIRLLYLTSASLPVIYWITIILFYPVAGILVFAVSKLMVFLIIGFFYLKYSLDFLQIKMDLFLKNYILPVIIPLVVIAGILIPVSLYFEETLKSYVHLFFIIMLVAFAIFSGFICYYLFSSPFRSYMNLLLKSFINRRAPGITK
jgi:O-antigen/teichoic acid export membrane protein